MQPITKHKHPLQPSPLVTVELASAARSSATLLPTGAEVVAEGGDNGQKYYCKYYYGNGIHRLTGMLVNGIGGLYLTEYGVYHKGYRVGYEALAHYNAGGIAPSKLTAYGGDGRHTWGI